MGKGTGACGVNCMVCGLFRQGKCSLCASGLEPEARDKLDAQLKMVGGNCPILACAVKRKIAYCSADCEFYPCKKFWTGPYPLSQGYLEMQLRRRGKPGPLTLVKVNPPPGKMDPKLH